jgi:hypothetical protein
MMLKSPQELGSFLKLQKFACWQDPQCGGRSDLEEWCASQMQAIYVGNYSR